MSEHERDPRQDPLKDIPESVFADDDGSADARLAQSLIRFSRGRAPLTEVVDALQYARVLVPVLAEGEQRIVGKHGLEQDHVASTGVVALQIPDGRAALPIFTDVDAMRTWNAEARPVPAEGPRAALAAAAEGWNVMVLNPAMESVVIPRPAVWALGQGETWRPAVVDDRVVDDVRDAIIEAIPLGDDVRRIDAAPGRQAEVAVVVALVPGLPQGAVNDAVRRVHEALAASSVVADRVDSMELRLATWSG
ncbi:SseB family protein [Demequina sp.]|uniref:SseB family protein n=1 Tax=Demequina sp. TaxID=2050685 RepID=UPI0025BB872C|nr:SseB family protein [Demequina sp.]